MTLVEWRGRLRAAKFLCDFVNEHGVEKRPERVRRPCEASVSVGSPTPSREREKAMGHQEKPTPKTAHGPAAVGVSGVAKTQLRVIGARPFAQIGAFSNGVASITDERTVSEERARYDSRTCG